MDGAAIRETWRKLQGRDIPLLLLLGILVCGAGWGRIELTHFTGRTSASWLPNALLVVAALKTRRRLLVAVFLVGFVGLAAGGLAAADNLPDLVVLPLVNLIEVAAVVLPLLRLGLAADLSTPRALIVFYSLALGPAGMLSSVLAAGYFSLAYGLPFWSIAPHWYFGDALSLVILVPPFAALRLADFTGLFSRSQWKGSVLLMAAMAGGCTIEKRLRHRIGLGVHLAIGDVAPIAGRAARQRRALADELALGMGRGLFLQHMSDGAGHLAQRMERAHIDRPVRFAGHIDPGRLLRQWPEGRRIIRFLLEIHGVISSRRAG